jgi:microcystin-dependent protein
MALSSLILGFTSYFIPITRNYFMAMSYYLAQGLCQAVYDLTGNVMIINLWSEINSSPINAKSIVMHATTDASNTPVDLAQSADIALIFKIKGNEIVRITANQRVGIGTTTPDEKLHVEGHIKMVDGNQQPNAVMTSDANGVGSWTPFSSVGVPVGVVVSYFGNTAPAGWLICNGTTIPAGSQYDALRTHMAQFGAPNVPDLQERFIVGVGNNATAGGPYGLAAAGGGYENYLSQDQIPAHSHEMRNDETSPGLMDGPNGATVNITLSGNHYHRTYGYNSNSTDDWNINMDNDNQGYHESSNNNGTLYAEHVHNNANFAGHTGNGRKNQNGANQLTWNGSTATSPINNLPPYYALLYIIKY